MSSQDPTVNDVRLEELQAALERRQARLDALHRRDWATPWEVAAAQAVVDATEAAIGRLEAEEGTSSDVGH